MNEAFIAFPFLWVFSLLRLNNKIVKKIAIVILIAYSIFLVVFWEKMNAFSIFLCLIPIILILWELLIQNKNRLKQQRPTKKHSNERPDDGR